MRILVTGGCGFIGSHLVRRLLADEHLVVVVDDGVTRDYEALAPGRGLCDIITVSICDSFMDTVFDKFRPEYVFHLAAQSSVEESKANPAHDLQVNILGTLNVLQKCLKYGVKKIIFASSGGTVYGDPYYFPTDEDFRLAPITPYGISKVAGESYIRYYASDADFRYSILRYGNVYGPGQYGLGVSGVVAIFCTNLIRGKECTIFGDGTSCRDYIYIDDVVEANIVALQDAYGGTYNISSGVSTSVLTIYEKLRYLVGSDREPSFVSSRDGEVNKVHLAVDKAYRVLDWRAVTDLDVGLESTVSYYRGIYGDGNT